MKIDDEHIWYFAKQQMEKDVKIIQEAINGNISGS